jgi:alpha-1,2-mannosyltransferase
MAAGTVILAHNSGGPKLDIVTDFNQQKTGYLADDIQSYAVAMETIFNLPIRRGWEIKENASQREKSLGIEDFEPGPGP